MSQFYPGAICFFNYSQPAINCKVHLDHSMHSFDFKPLEALLEPESLCVTHCFHVIFQNMHQFDVQCEIHSVVCNLFKHLIIMHDFLAQKFNYFAIFQYDVILLTCLLMTLKSFELLFQVYKLYVTLKESAFNEVS